MPDPQIEKLKQRGIVASWHYEGFPKNFSGYHLTADHFGCEFLLKLFELFKSTPYPARKEIILNRPTAKILSVPNCPRNCIPSFRLQIRYLQSSPQDSWSVTESGSTLTIKTGERGLDALSTGISDIHKGKGDRSIGSGHESLWFWWFPNSN